MFPSEHGAHHMQHSTPHAPHSHSTSSGDAASDHSPLRPVCSRASASARSEVRSRYAGMQACRPVSIVLAEPAPRRQQRARLHVTDEAERAVLGACAAPEVAELRVAKFSTLHLCTARHETSSDRSRVRRSETGAGYFLATSATRSAAQNGSRAGAAGRACAKVCARVRVRV